MGGESVVLATEEDLNKALSLFFGGKNELKQVSIIIQ